MAVWLGGLTARFAASPARIHALAGQLNHSGISFGTFDHRGLGTVTVKKQFKKKPKYIFLGTSFEKFEHCLLDIEAIIKFLKKRGYRNIFFLGHSTGANKLAYYIEKRRGKELKGVGLLGPLSDIPDLKKGLGRKYTVALKEAQKMIKKGRGQDFMPSKLVGSNLWSALRFWSIARENSNEDTFTYYRKQPFRWAKKINLPIFVIIGGKEQYADRPVGEIMDFFQKQIPSKYFRGQIVAGADHGFSKKEKELARIISKWIKSLIF